MKCCCVRQVWASELIQVPVLTSTAADLGTLPKPTPEWYARRKQMYEDPEPHRHKFDKDQMEKERKAVAGQLNRNQAMYSLHLALDGTERRFNYVESRYFYCCAYEKLALLQPAFQQLLEWHQEGVDLRLCGYDAFDMGVSADADALYMHYCDPRTPFGHERVLYALLMLAGKRDDFPWHRFRREHPERYEGIAHVA